MGLVWINTMNAGLTLAALSGCHFCCHQPETLLGASVCIWPWNHGHGHFPALRTAPSTESLLTLESNCPSEENKPLNSKCELAEHNCLQTCQWQCSLLYPRWRSFLSHEFLFSISLLQGTLPLVLFQLVIWQVFFLLQPRLESPLYLSFSDNR